MRHDATLRLARTRCYSRKWKGRTHDKPLVHVRVLTTESNLRIWLDNKTPLHSSCSPPLSLSLPLHGTVDTAVSRTRMNYYVHPIYSELVT